MIAPTFESLATKYTKPKRIAFAKIDVDKLRDVASQHGVRAMPTFIIFKNGTAVETIQGANPPKLTQAVENAVKLAGPSASSGFSAPGRTLGGTSGAGARSGTSLQRPISWDVNNLINAIIGFFGLYFVSLFSVCGVAVSLSLRSGAAWIANKIFYSSTLTKPPRIRDTMCTILLDLRQRAGQVAQTAE